MDMPKYAEIMAIERYKLYKEHNVVEEKGQFILEEKLDGSQFRFGIDGEGKFYSGSKGINYSDENQPERMFKTIVEQMEILLKTEYAKETFKSFLKAPDDMLIFYGEYLRSQRHNAIKYDRVPIGNIYLFDIAKNGAYLGADETKNWALALGLEPVNILGRTDKLPTYQEVQTQANTTKSQLGDILIEGIVIKNYDFLIKDNHRNVETPFMIKVVRDEYKEIQKKTWKAEQGKGIDEVVARVVNQVNKNAVWDKAIQHLTEAGQLQGAMQDMKIIIAEVDAEIEKEWQEVIFKELYKSFDHDIRKAFTRGLPEYYKEKCYNNVAEAVNQPEKDEQ